MRHARLSMWGCTALLSVTFGASAAAVDLGHGKALVDKHCMACHKTEVYTRPNHRMQSLEMLTNQVTRCRKAAGVNWSADEIADVVGYLNHNFYKFK